MTNFSFQFSLEYIIIKHDSKKAWGMARGLKNVNNGLDQWVSTFLMLTPFNTLPHVVVTPNHKIIFIAMA